MINLTRVKCEFNEQKALTVGTDVAKLKLDAYSEVREVSDLVELKETVSNRTKALEKFLNAWMKVAREYGYERLLIAVEATGSYEKRLLKVARRLGHLVCYVSGEATSKSKVIESNDASKTDPKDARIIYRLAEQRRTLTARELPDVYAQLRFVHKAYNSEEERGAAIKNEFRNLLDEQFPDLDVLDSQLFGVVGQALAEVYGFCGHRIVMDGQERFIDRMLDAVHGRKGRMAMKTLHKLYKQAEQSACLLESAAVLDLRSERLCELHTLYRQCRARVAEYKQELVRLFRQTEEHAKLMQLPKVSELQLARLVAETGRFKDFDSFAQLQRYLGMNLRVRQSGFYKGRAKLSKKGRSLGRKVLYQLVLFFMVGEGRVLHEYYQKKKGENRGSVDAMTTTMRKALKLIWGLFRSVAAYDPQRVYHPLTEATVAAA